MGWKESPFDYGICNFTIEIVGLAEGTYEFFLKMPMDVQKEKKSP